MEVGVGEATLMNPLMKKLDPNNEIEKFGFDISWSRTRYAVQNSHAANNEINLFVADLFDIPLPDNSIDIVYSSHSLEPNGSKGKRRLKGTLSSNQRVFGSTGTDFDRASAAGKARMSAMDTFEI